MEHTGLIEALANLPESERAKVIAEAQKRATENADEWRVDSLGLRYEVRIPLHENIVKVAEAFEFIGWQNVVVTVNARSTLGAKREWRIGRRKDLD